jgi:hypothetical protein
MSPIYGYELPYTIGSLDVDSLMMGKRPSPHHLLLESLTNSRRIVLEGGPQASDKLLFLCRFQPNLPATTIS